MNDENVPVAINGIDLWRLRWGIRLWQLRAWLLGNADGSPPNNWQTSPKFTGRRYGIALSATWWSLSFLSDGGEIGIAVKFHDEAEEHWDSMIPTDAFRNLALWYLWRWAVGEWFGLRRWLYYWDLSRRVREMERLNE